MEQCQALLASPGPPHPRHCQHPPIFAFGVSVSSTTFRPRWYVCRLVAVHLMMEWHVPVRVLMAQMGSGKSGTQGRAEEESRWLPCCARAAERGRPPCHWLGLEGH